MEDDYFLPKVILGPSVACPLQASGPLQARSTRYSGNSAQATEVPAAATGVAKLTWPFSAAGARPSDPLIHCTPTKINDVGITIIPIYR